MLLALLLVRRRKRKVFYKARYSSDLHTNKLCLTFDEREMDFYARAYVGIEILIVWSVRRPLRNLRDRTVIIYHGVFWFVNNFGGRLGWTPYHRTLKDPLIIIQHHHGMSPWQHLCEYYAPGF